MDKGPFNITNTMWGGSIGPTDKCRSALQQSNGMIRQWTLTQLDAQVQRQWILMQWAALV